MHPLYGDEALVEKVTLAHMDAGCTIFQLWTTHAEEQRHADNMLDLVAPPHRATVISLGCGVGGMEFYWQDARPDMEFDLVNASGSQLAQCLCDGNRIEQDMVTWWPEDDVGYDVAILAYVLGHVPAAAMVSKACHIARTVLVLDIFDATPEQCQALAYNAPTSDVMTEDFEQVKGLNWICYAPLAGESAEVQALVRLTKPACWIRRG